MEDTKQPFPTYEAWASEIGSFVLKFGHLEYLVFAYIKDHVAPAAKQPPAKLHFTDRLKKIEKHFNENPSPEAAAAFAEWQRELEPIRKFRNHIAHGYLHAACLGTVPDIAICQVNDLDTESGQRVTFSELQTNNVTLSNLINQFSALAGWKS